jgi:hypothetical protein
MLALPPALPLWTTRGMLRACGLLAGGALVAVLFMPEALEEPEAAGETTATGGILGVLECCAG